MTSSTDQIDAARALELLRQAVALKGADYVYKPSDLETTDLNCVYVRDGRPACLVATALHVAGVPISVLSDMDAAFHVIGDTSFDVVCSTPGLPSFITPAVEVLRAAQQLQDSGMPWGHVVDVAEVMSS